MPGRLLYKGIIIGLVLCRTGKIQRYLAHPSFNFYRGEKCGIQVRSPFIYVHHTLIVSSNGGTIPSIFSTPYFACILGNNRLRRSQQLRLRQLSRYRHWECY